MFISNNKDTLMTLAADVFLVYCYISLVEFEHVFICWERAK